MYQISDYCVGCHNCAMECPMQAIQFVGTKYEIDQDKCVGCGLCEKLCHTCSISDVDAPVEVNSHEPVEKHCDVVVCGGGTGLVAAVRAAQKGKKVILLEASKKLGGNTDYAHGFFPIYCKLHQKHGLPDATEKAIEVYYQEADGGIEHELIAAAVRGENEFFDWLLELYPETEDAVSFEAFEREMKRGPVYGWAMLEFVERRYDNLLCRDPAIGPGWGGTYLKYKMLDLIEKEHLDVEILTEHRARRLIADDSGTVRGVIADDPGGQTLVHASAVILSTGGFGRSDEKLMEFNPFFFEGETKIHRFSVPTDRGDGIDMLRGMGVEPDPDRMFSSIFGPSHHPYHYSLLQISTNPTALQVNLNGKRWFDETGGPMGGRFHIAEQPKEISWSIMSQETIDEAVGRVRLRNSHDSWVYDFYQQDLEEEMAYPMEVAPGAPVRKADTIEALAVSIGVDPQTLRETVDRYNSHCKAGVDPDFGKTAEFLLPVEHGPYYAIYGQRFSEGSFGGVRVNGKTEVTREDGTVIPGLYATGDATSAMHRKGELAVITELTWATASTYLAGGNAADYADSLK